MASDTTPAVPPSARVRVRDHITRLLQRHAVVDYTVALGVPTQWHPDESSPHIQVSDDGAPDLEKGWGRVGPSMQRGPIRITVWHHGTSSAENMANWLLGRLLVERPPAYISSLLPGPGVLTVRDDSGAELAFFTVRCTTVFPPA